MNPEDADEKNHEQASISVDEHQRLKARIAELEAENASITGKYDRLRAGHMSAVEAEAVRKRLGWRDYLTMCNEVRKLNKAHARKNRRISSLRAENERLKAIENAAFDFFCAVDVDPDKSPTFRALRDALSVIDSAVFDAGGIEDG